MSADGRWESGWRPHAGSPSAADVRSADATAVDEYWCSRHWAVPSLYSPEEWYEAELERLRDRAPA